MASGDTMRRQMRDGTSATALLSLLCACAGLTDTVADLLPTPDGAPASDAGETGTQAVDGDASATGPHDGDMPRSDAGLCLGALAAQTFRHALCACNSLELPFGGLMTDAYDSSRGSYTASRVLDSLSHVGVNAKLSAADRITVGGSLVVADALGPSALPVLDVRGDLRVGGPFAYTNSVDVGGDLWLASDLMGSAALHVAGNLIQPEMGARSASPALLVDGSDLRGPVAIADPCACDGGTLEKIGDIVVAARAHNDNAEAGIAPERAELVLLSDERIELPPGKRVFLTSIATAGTVTFAVAGRSVLVVEQGIDVAGALNLELGPEAELDLFVGKHISVGVLEAPPPAENRPARLRIYLAGDYFHAQVFSAANVYAPNALALPLASDLYGSLFAKEIYNSIGSLRMHYDTSVVAESRDCDWFDLSAVP
jgi:hypothetical protein